MSAMNYSKTNIMQCLPKQAVNPLMVNTGYTINSELLNTNVYSLSLIS